MPIAQGDEAQLVIATPGPRRAVKQKTNKHKQQYKRAHHCLTFVQALPPPTCVPGSVSSPSLPLPSRAEPRIQPTLDRPPGQNALSRPRRRTQPKVLRVLLNGAAVVGPWGCRPLHAPLVARAGAADQVVRGVQLVDGGVGGLPCRGAGGGMVRFCHVAQLAQPGFVAHCARPRHAERGLREKEGETWCSNIHCETMGDYPTWQRGFDSANLHSPFERHPGPRSAGALHAGGPRRAPAMPPDRLRAPAALTANGRVPRRFSGNKISQSALRLAGI